MSRRAIAALALVAVLTVAAATPVAAARPADCTLQLDVPPTSPYGETVVLEVSGLTGIGGIDIFTSWRNRTEEAHLLLVPGITEFDFMYRAWAPEGEVLPPLEPGTYRVHAVDATGCEATTMFRVTT